MNTEPNADPTPAPESSPANGNQQPDNITPPAEGNQENPAPPADPQLDDTPTPEPELTPAPNPFDFTQPEEESEADSKPGEEEDTNDEQEEYVLDLGANYDGDDATRDMLTGHAKACGISAEAAGKFIQSVAQDLARNSQAMIAEQDQSLREEWGSDYEGNMRATGAYLRERMAAAGIPESAAPQLMNATVFRLMNYERSLSREAPARGAESAPLRTKEQQYRDFIRDPANHAILMDPGHPNYNEIAAKANALHPLGMRMY